jgi:hypothetical protein
MYSLLLKLTSLMSVALLSVLSACGEARTEAELPAELLQMVRADQEVRERLNAVVSAGGSEVLSTEEGRKLLEEMTAVDEENRTRLDEIISRHGWPGASSVGAEAASAASLILQHADIGRQERYLPLLRQAVKDGHAEALSLAELEDEVSVANSGSQLYGTEISFDLVTRVAKLVPVIDPERLDARRAEIGLPPIAEYLAQAEAELGIPVDRSALASE